MIIEIEMNEQEYAFGAKFNYDMYTHHQDGWKDRDLWTTRTGFEDNHIEISYISSVNVVQVQER